VLSNAGVTDPGLTPDQVREGDRVTVDAGPGGVEVWAIAVL
jgi:hypothetical protein